MKLLKQLSEAAGVPGREENIRAIVRKELKGKVDSLTEDAMGNLIAFKKGSATRRKRIMFAAHMDEIGFYVRHIDDKGFIRVQNLGGFDTRNLFARKMLVHGERDTLSGVMNATGKPIHLSSADDKSKYKEISDFYIDIGLQAKVVKSKVKIGDPITFDVQFMEYGELVSGKCLDNRASVWVGLRTLQKMKRPKHDIYGVFTVQEEVGLRGAFTSSYGVDPEIGIALDVTLACDTPGISPDQYITELGKGPGIKIMDGSLISNREIVDDFIALAKKSRIPYQLEVLPAGGTDAGAIQRTRSGVKAFTLSIPTRYIHTITESLHVGDLKHTQKLLQKYLEK